MLINHWSRFDSRDLEPLIETFYRRMIDGRGLMPGEQMRRVTRRMVEYDWFGSYRDVDAVAESLDRVAGRIRFENRFAGAIEELQRNHDLICEGFFEFYPQLQRHIEGLGLEID